MATEPSRFVAALIAGLDSFGSRPAVGLRGEFGVRWRTYEELRRDILWFAQRLAAEQIGSGDRILLWAPNLPEWVACLLGALLRGAVVVPVDATASPEFVERIAVESAARIVFHSPELDASFLPIPGRRLVEHRGNDSLGTQPRLANALPGPDDPAVIMYTSGSTSAPRGVVLTHRNIEAQMSHFRHWRKLVLAIPFRMLVIAPLSHVQGLIMGSFLPLSIGLSVVFVRSVHPPHLLRTLRDNRVTLFSTVPRVLSALTRAVEARPYKSGPETVGQRMQNERRGFVRRHILFLELNRVIGLRFWVIFVGGATLSRHDEQFWRDTGRFVIQGYGLTETTALVAVNGPFSRSVGSIGTELKHVSIRIADDGELLVSGPNVSPDYTGEGPNAGVSHEGVYLRTGDLVRRAGRRLYFVGRKKDIIVTSEGFNVSPSDVESALGRVQGVVDSTVFARRGEDGDEVHAVLLLGPGTEPAQAVQRANALLMPEQRIRSWRIWPEPDFPRTALLKVRREDVKARAEDIGPSVTESQRQPSAVTPDMIAGEPNRRTRISLLARYLIEAPREEVRRNQSQLAMDFGLSSLDFVQLLARLEELWGRKLSSVHLPLNATVSNVLAALSEESLRAPGGSRLPAGQPFWAEWPPLAGLRAVIRPAVVASWRALCGHCSATWLTGAERLSPPFFLAVAPHRHWLDAFAVASVLPERLARRVLVVTNRDFSEFFDPGPETPIAERFKVGLGYYLGLPLTYPFTIVPQYGATREGLLETMRWVDKGYCPLVFPKGILFGEIDQNRHDLGPAVLAIEAGLPIVPVWICGNDSLSFRPSRSRPRVRVMFAPPVTTSPDDKPTEIRDRVEAAWRSLAAQEV